MPKSVLFDRDEVIWKVTNLFWTKGYHGTSMQDLVDVTGLNRSSFYNSFGDKFSLFQESLKQYQNFQDAMFDNAISETKSPKEAIISLFEGIRDDIIVNQNHQGCFFVSCTSELSSEDSKIKDFLVENMKGVVSTFQELIESAQKAGEIDQSKDARSLALYLFSSLQGLRITSMIESEVTGITTNILAAL